MINPTDYDALRSAGMTEREALTAMNVLEAAVDEGGYVVRIPEGQPYTSEKTARNKDDLKPIYPGATIYYVTSFESSGFSYSYLTQRNRSKTFLIGTGDLHVFAPTTFEDDDYPPQSGISDFVDARAATDGGEVDGTKGYDRDPSLPV